MLHTGGWCHIEMSHVTHRNEPCHTSNWYEYMCDMTHPCAYMNIYKWIMSHIWMSHVTHRWMVPQSCKEVISFAKETYIFTEPTNHSHMNESCHRYEWVMLHTGGWCHNPAERLSAGQVAAGMCVCMCLQVCVCLWHTHTCTHIPTRRRTHTHTHTNTRIQTCIYIDVYIYTHVYVRSLERSRRHTHMHVCVCANIHTCTCDSAM